MEKFDPHALDQAIVRTAADQLEQDEVYQRAVALAVAVQDLYAFAREVPRWESLHDQIARASSSVALNFAQGCAKLRGYTQSDWLCARAELAEVLAGLSIGPACFRELKPQAKELYARLDSRILGLAPKPVECRR